MGGFVLTGTAPAARAFFEGIVAALAAREPGVTERTVRGAIYAIQDLPGFTELERKRILVAAHERLRRPGAIPLTEAAHILTLLGTVTGVMVRHAHEIEATAAEERGPF